MLASSYVGKLDNTGDVYKFKKLRDGESEIWKINTQTHGEKKTTYPNTLFQLLG